MMRACFLLACGFAEGCARLGHSPHMIAEEAASCEAASPFPRQFPKATRARRSPLRTTRPIVSGYSAAYSSSDTGSSHSFDAPSAGTAMATCANQLSGAAPCQCFTSDGMFTTSPGFNSRAGPPHAW